ncbi:MAG: hypothetical protein ABMA26_15100 [Limisphaerales bacterium]
MKKLLIPLALAAAGWFIWKRWFSPRSALGDHLAEEAALQHVGTIATRSSIEAIPATTSQEFSADPMAIGQVWVPPSLAAGGPLDVLYGYRRNQWGILVN